VPLGEAVVRGKLFYGLANTKLPLADRQWDIGGSPMAGGHVEYQSDAWQLRASYANIVFKNDLPLGGLGLSSTELAHLAWTGKRSDYFFAGRAVRPRTVADPADAQPHRAAQQYLRKLGRRYLLAGYRIGAADALPRVTRASIPGRATTR
jgi:hypothetical protein